MILYRIFPCLIWEGTDYVFHISIFYTLIGLMPRCLHQKSGAVTSLVCSQVVHSDKKASNTVSQSALNWKRRISAVSHIRKN